MRGELDFERACGQRVALLAGLDAAALDRVYDDLVLAPGARTLVRTLKRLGYRFAIVTGGFTQVTDRIAADLGIDYSRRQRARGRRRPAHRPRSSATVVDRAGKAEALRRFAAEAGVSEERDGRDRRRRQRPRHALRRRARHRVQRQAGGAGGRRTPRSTCPTSTRSCTCSASPARRSRPPTPSTASPRPLPPSDLAAEVILAARVVERSVAAVSVRPATTADVRRQPCRRGSRSRCRTLGEVGPVDGDLEHGERRGREALRTSPGRRPGRGRRRRAGAQVRHRRVVPDEHRTVGLGRRRRAAPRAPRPRPAPNSPSSTHDHRGARRRPRPAAPRSACVRAADETSASSGTIPCAASQAPAVGGVAAPRSVSWRAWSLGRERLGLRVPHHDQCRGLGLRHGRHSGIPIGCLSCRHR